MVEARADDPAGHSPHGDTKDEVPFPALPRPEDPAEADRREDPEEEHDPVGVEGQPSELELAARGAGNGREHAADSKRSRRGEPRVPPVAGGAAPPLQQDPQSRRGRTPAAGQRDRTMKIDVATLGELEGRVPVIAGPLKLLDPPAEHALGLRLARIDDEFCGRHDP